jgi:diguanylate cyclase (GGDEF)-like protein
MRLINEMGDLLQVCNDLGDSRAVLNEFVPKMFEHDSGAIYVLSASRNIADSIVTWGDRHQPSLIRSEDCWALRRGRLHSVPSRYGMGLVCPHHNVRKADGTVSSVEGCVGYTCVPLVAQGEALGVLSVCLGSSGGMSLEVRESMAFMVADQFGLALSNLNLRQRLQDQSIRDPLTNLYNRRYLHETFDRELKRCQRQETPLCVAMLDLDHFKSFNDTVGHIAADGALREFGALMSGFFRAEDVVSRYGGEEFVIVLPDTSLEDAVSRINTLRLRMPEISHSSWGRDLSFSAGLSCYPGHGRTTEDLLGAADTVLYQAKSAGRNQIVCAEEENSD